MPQRICASDSDYPAALRDLQDVPDPVFVEGALPQLERAVAIVGTRRADGAGTRFTRQLAAELARADCTIVSGGAHGIDTAAHEGALDVGGATVAVLPGRVDAPYPARNRELFALIARTGALLAEHEFDTRRYASVFLARNRLIAALARLVVVVQAPVKSGAMSTAAHARAMGRPVLAVPWAPWEARGAGCLHLLGQGAQVCRSSDDVLALIAPACAPARRPPREQAHLDGDQRAVYDALAGGALSADELCEQTGMPAAVTQRALLLLLLAGEIQELTPGRYAAQPR
ncbi:MAG TPA: DNA-processing protein DprA [Polyangiales bacterium]